MSHIKHHIEFTWFAYPDTYKLRPTGKWKIEIEGGILRLYIQSWWFPWFKTWVNEEDITVREWSVYHNECS